MRSACRSKQQWIRLSGNMEHWAAVFFAGVSATVYFCRSMCCEMEMPVGWTMSMMWHYFGSHWGAGGGFLTFPHKRSNHEIPSLHLAPYSTSGVFYPCQL